MRQTIDGVVEILCDACGAFLRLAGDLGGPERHRDPFDCVAILQDRLARLERNSRVIHVPD